MVTRTDTVPMEMLEDELTVLAEVGGYDSEREVIHHALELSSTVASFYPTNHALPIGVDKWESSVSDCQQSCVAFGKPTSYL